MKVLLKSGLIAAVSIIVLAVVGVSAVLVWGSWISPFEKRAMNSALDRIDEVGSYDGSGPAVYEAKLKSAKVAIAKCEGREITGYDKHLVPLLNMQLDGAEAEHEARLREASDQRFAVKVKLLDDSNHQTEAMLREHLK